MTVQSFPVHILPSGVVTPISGWTGGEADGKITIESSGQELGTCHVRLEGMSVATMKETHSERLEKRLNENTFIKAKRKATPEEVQKFMDTCFGCLEGFSEEEFEQMKMERILGK